MLNISFISFELAKRIHFFEAFRQKGPELRIAVAEGFKTISNGSLSFRRKLLKVPYLKLTPLFEGQAHFVF